MCLILVKKMQVSWVYQRDDWYKSEKSRMHILPLVYLSKSFLPIQSHQPCKKEFIVHLENIVMEKPDYARDSEIEDVQWNDVKETLKAMWRKFHKGNAKQRTCYQHFLVYSKIIYKSYE